jgi:hypothetical protein
MLILERRKNNKWEVDNLNNQNQQWV